MVDPLRRVTSPQPVAYRGDPPNGMETYLDIEGLYRAAAQHVKALNNLAVAIAEKANLSHVHAGEDITSGIVPDARIQESGVTQHESAINHDELLNFAAIEHRIINDAGTGLTELFSASKINADIAGRAAAAHTHAGADINSGTLPDARIQESGVTQHEGAIDHDELTGFVAGEHRIINDAGTGVAELFSASKISTDIAAKPDSYEDLDDVAAFSGNGGELVKCNAGETALEFSGVVAGIGIFDLPEVTTPSSPSAGRRQLYAKSDGIYMQNSSGVETALGTD